MRLLHRFPPLVVALFLLLQMLALPAALARADHLPGHIETILSSQRTGTGAFGTALALSGDTLAIGDPYDNERGTQTGAVYIYTRQNGAWTRQAKLFAAVPQGGSQFGRVLDLQGDTLVTSASNESGATASAGAVYVFVREGTTWRQQSRLVPSSTASNLKFGRALDLDGTRLAVASDQGNSAIHVLDRTGEQWTQTALIGYDGSAGDKFGAAIIVQDRLLVVGAPGYVSGFGAVLIYAGTANGWSQQQRLSGVHGQEQLGASLALLNDTLVVGAPGHLENGQTGGGAYVFRRGASGWSQEALLTMPGLVSGDQFGAAVAIGETMVLVGAPNQSPAGSAYAFTSGTNGWQRQMTLQRPNQGTNREGFGSTIAVGGGFLAIAAPNTENENRVATGVVVSTSLHSLTRVNNDSARTSEEQPVTIDLLANDVLFDDNSAFDRSLAPVLIQRAPTLGSVQVTGNGQVIYTPAVNKTGVDTFVYTAGWGTSATVSVTIDPVADPPIFTSTPKTSAETTQLYSYTVVASDPDTGDALTLSAPQLPGWLSLTPGQSGTATLSGTPTAQNIGTHAVQLVVTDSTGLSTTQTFTITVVLFTPEAPLDLSATAISPSVIQLSWTDASSDETGFRIERSSDAGATWQVVTTVAANTTGFRNGARVCNTPYRYRVFAVKGSRSSASSNEAHVTIADCTLAAPIRLAAGVLNATTVRLEWWAQTGSERGYRIERSDDGGSSWNQIGEASPTTTVLVYYNDTTVVCGPTYQYRVRSFHDFAVSEPSNIASVRACAPSQAPGNLTATTVSRHQINLAWIDTNDGLESFNLEYSTTDGVWTKYTGPIQPSFTSRYHLDLPCNTTFTYRVAAYNNAGQGPYSNLATATTEPCIHQIIYVDRDATGANDGSSWADAYTSLQSALPAAGHDADTVEIWLAEGVYKPGASERSASFRIVDSTVIYGGFSGDETSRDQRDWRQYPTILSGELGVAGIFGDNSFHVVMATNVDSTAGLDGLTITGGNANSSPGEAKNRGGGLYNDHADLTVRNVIFLDNQAIFGGGVANGGASPTFTNVQFLNNSAGSGGGGVYNYSGSSPTLINAVFSGNNANVGGAAHNTLDSDPLFLNVTFSDNVVSGDGAALYNTFNANPEIRNAIFWGNRSQKGSSGDVAQIFAGSDDAQATVSDTLLQTAHSGASTRTRIADPQFVDADGPDNLRGTLDDDLRLRESSPAIDAGNNTSLPPAITTDLAGNDRFRDHQMQPDTGVGTRPIVDLGAYEFQPADLSGQLPLAFTATARSRSIINLTWVDQITGESGFQIERRPIDGEEWAEIARVPANTTSYREGRLSCASGYAYRVRAFGPGGVSEYSDVDDATTDVCQPVTLYVDNSASGFNSGTTWPNAYTELHEALAVAQPGDQIWIAAGTYKPTSDGDRSVSFELRDEIAIYGGFVGGETSLDQRQWRQYPTILSGDLNGDDPPGLPTDQSWQTLMDDNSAHVLLSQGTTTTAILDGVTISGGQSGQSQGTGGGLLNDGGQPTLRNLIFRSNMANNGGGMAEIGGGRSTLINVTFSENYALNGAGMYTKASSPALQSVTFVDNHAEAGSMYNDASSPTLRDVEFRENQSSGGAAALFNRATHATLIDVRLIGNSGGMGALVNTANSDALLLRVTFSQNIAKYSGNDGGGGMTNQASNPTLIDVVFEDNQSAAAGGGLRNVGGSPRLINVRFGRNLVANNLDYEGGGGGMYTSGGAPVLQNVVFSNNGVLNSRDDRGGAIVNYGSNLTLIHVTATGNLAARGGTFYSSGGSLIIANSIVWNAPGTGSREPIFATGALDIRHSLIQGGTVSAGNLDRDPLFRDADGADNILGTRDDDLRLLAQSPAIDAADNQQVLADTADLDDDGDTAEPLPYDLDGFARFRDLSTVPDQGSGTAPIADMGAYEYQPTGQELNKLFLPFAGAGSGS